MGDPPKLRNKYEKPKRLWDADRLQEDKGLKHDFGLKNAREIWLAMAILKKYRREARRLLSLAAEEREADAPRILARLDRMGVLAQGASVDDILSLNVRNILERRLQTIVLRKGLAYTMAQSRQLITHGYIKVGDRVVTIPSQMLFKGEEAAVAYSRPIELKHAVVEAAPEPVKAPAEAAAPAASA